MQPKPARRYFVKALPYRDVFRAQFASPGRIPVFVQDQGAPVLYDTEVDAIADAGETLCEVLNAKPPMSMKHTHQRMHHIEFANAMSDLNLTVGELAWLFGTSEARVIAWLEGSQDIPHPIRLLMAAFAHPGVLNIGRQITSMVADKTERKVL